MSVTEVRSLKAGTFNAKFLPRVPTDRRRVRALAERVRASDYDILALNEIFDDGARRILVRTLRTVFPHYVSYLRGSRWLTINSGLMVFSRFPFLPLPNSQAYPAHRTVAINGPQGRWDEVAFVAFRDSRDSDRFASKGFALVRLGVGSHVVNVGTLHLQASYPRDRHRPEVKSALRRSQLRQVTDVIGAVLGTEVAEREDLILLGDFNIGGPPAGWGPPQEADDAPWRDWVVMMDRLNRVVPQTPFVDLWWRHAADGAAGLTYPAVRSQARYDYILWSPALRDASPLAVVDVDLAHDLIRTTGNGADAVHLSDHVGVNARWCVDGR